MGVADRQQNDGVFNKFCWDNLQFIYFLKRNITNHTQKIKIKDNVYKCKNYFENNFHLKEVVFSNS